MNALIVDLVTKQPVLVSALEGDPNSATSFSYIPGSVLRGALISRYLQSKGAEYQLDLGNQLFFSNQVRFLHAYPLESTTNKRMLPMIQKLDLQDQAVAESETKKAKEPKYEWFGEHYTFDTVRHLNIHTTRNRAKGRSLRGSGAVYRYVAIAPNQVFRAVILGDSIDLQVLEALLRDQPRLYMGKARSAGYGESQIIKLEHNQTWHELPYAPTNSLPTTETVTMTLLSDAIIRDQYGQYGRIGADPTGLAASFGLQAGQLDLKASKLRYTVLGGFNRTWGLPLPQTPAVAAGSVLVWQQARADWPALVEQGIGERRNEGFGRISLDAALQGHVINLQNNQPSINSNGGLLPIKSTQTGFFVDESSKLLHLMGQRLIRQRLDQRLIELIGDYQIKRQADSRNSLFGRVELWCRALLTNIQTVALHQTANTSVDSVFATFRETIDQTAQIARQHLHATSLANGQSLETLLKLDIAELLELWQVERLQLGDHLAQLTPQLALEYHARLIIAIVTMARKQPLLKKRG
ncbi:RAMP superfamily CRISPR-associated protein [Herpetosiphon gulosus]|uniref:CRISPR type III-associated protein domain-containing protein n=1 Tax=Herpetosiphon gulosus TaxID=1973496 RepID=A0ABP9X6M8_9CHLR